MIRSWIDPFRLWLSHRTKKKQSDASPSNSQDDLPEHWDPPESLQSERDSECSSDWRYQGETGWEDWDDRPRRGHRGRDRG